jgi:GntP family gluconate:H+ symporter
MAASLSIVLLGVAVVLVALLVFKLHPFFGLTAGALMVSFADGLARYLDASNTGASNTDTPIDLVGRVAYAFGEATGKIGIPIAAAAVIGAALVASGAADRIVRAFTRLFGIERAATALATSGFVLAIPVFFDTVFYLLLPLAKSLHRQTRKNYLLYLLAIGAGGTVTHTLVPPTPGPLFVAAELGVSLGRMMFVGVLVGIPVTIVGLWLCKWFDRHVQLAHIPEYDDDAELERDDQLPSLFVSLLPIVLPILLITLDNFVDYFAKLDPTNQTLASFNYATGIIGDPQLVLLASAAISLALYWYHRTPSRDTFTELVEVSIAQAGSIILITAAGGAFGAMLRATGIGDDIKSMGLGSDTSQNMALVLLAFAVAAFIKFAQGSATTAMITTAGIMAAIIGPPPHEIDPSYIAAGIGTGAMVGAWMNDSGFWLFCRLSGISSSEGLRTWTPLLAIMGCVGLGVTLILAAIGI